MPTRRELLKSAAALLASQWAAAHGWAEVDPTKAKGERKTILIACGGIRRSDSFSATGRVHIPHLSGELLNQSVFYSDLRNLGATSHYNTISSVLTGQWQRLDDWGKSAPSSPTFFEHLRKSRRLGPEQTWLISSNKALTRKIGSSEQRDFGPDYGANVIFPKQLLINAVVRAAQSGRAVHSTDRSTVQPELMAMLNRDNFDGMGWSVAGEHSNLDSSTLDTVQQAIEELVHTNDPVTGDEFTCLVSLEVMRRFAPSIMVITFSDMEVAHFGSYSLYLAGISTVDRLVKMLWDHAQQMHAYRDRTTLFVFPEFGRDEDGSTTNGFFNHRQNSETTRSTWMMCLGEAVRKPQMIEEPVTQTSLFHTVCSMQGVHVGDGPTLKGLWL